VWLRRANQRIHATTKVRPSEAIFEDRGSMMSFPPVLPDPSWRFATRLGGPLWRSTLATEDFDRN
jgi:hypothetical protein